MRLLKVAMISGVMSTACDEPKQIEPIQTTQLIRTGQKTCEDNGGIWSEFKTTQGVFAEICFRPPSEQVLASVQN